MALSLQTNIDSLNAQRNLSTSQSSLSQALQRLSSGLRINSAADDPAGLAIGSNFTTQINGTNQAVANANFAVSESQTAGGALTTITDNLQSIRTLAVEAANGSNSAADRAALDQQVQQQISEITQIAAQTSFNGVNVLDGSSGTQTYQVGANVGNTISINLSQGVRANQIGQYAQQTGTAVTAVALTSASTVSITDGTTTVVAGPSASYVGANATYQGANSAYAKAAAINAANLQGLTATAATTATEAAAFSNVTAVSTAATYDLSINGVAIYSGTGNVAVGTPLTAAAVATQVNLSTNTTGVTASVGTGANAGKLTFSNTDGTDINIVQTVAAGTVAGSTVTGTGINTNISGGVAGAGATTTGQITLGDVNAVTIADSGTAGGSAALGFTSNTTITLGTSTLANQNVKTVAGANATIQAVDSALQTVSNFQSQLGAIQNRFTSAVNNLQSESQNLTSSRSTIVNADFAAETANLTKSQVLQQAGIAVLAQANQEPQLILKLLP